MLLHAVFLYTVQQRPIGSCHDVTSVLWLLFTHRFQQPNVRILPGFRYFEHFRSQNFPSSQQFLRDKLLVVKCADVSEQLSEFSYGEICKHIPYR
jgi:hypothetical protein